MADYHSERKERHHAKGREPILTRTSKEIEARYERRGKVGEVERLELQMQALSSEVESELGILGIKHGMSILDVGCGSGGFARRVAPLVSPAIVHAIDSDPLFLREAKRLADSEGIRNVAFENYDILDMGFEASTFDLTYCRFILPFIRNQAQLMSELTRVTREGGLIASSEAGYAFNYPPMPKFERIFDGIAKWRKKRTGVKRPPTVDAYELFKRHMLDSVTAYPIPIFASQNEPERLRHLTSVQSKMLEIHKGAALSGGFMKMKDYVAGTSELETWLAKPNAFVMVLCVLTLGRVPTKGS